MHNKTKANTELPQTIGSIRGMIQNSDRCLVALSRDIFERHTMHHSKDLVFTFIMMLMFSQCTVSINNYSILYIVHSIPLAFFHIIEL